MTWNNEDVSDGSDLVMGFATDEAKPDEFEVLPDGDYPCLIAKISVKATKDGNGKRANVQLNITDGDHKGRVLFDGINVLLPSSEKAEAIGRKQLAGLLEAAGKKGERNLANLVQCEVIAKVRTQAAKDGYDARNIVRGYKPMGGVAAAPSAPTGQAKSTPAFMTVKTGKAAPPTLAK